MHYSFLQKLLYKASRLLYQECKNLYNMCSFLFLFYIAVESFFVFFGEEFL